MSTSPSLGTVIRTARTLRRLTLRDTSAGSRISISRLAAIEHDEIKARPDEFKRLWDFLSEAPKS
jgi:cytoskeletal protein RodZ